MLQNLPPLRFFFSSLIFRCLYLFSFNIFFAALFRTDDTNQSKKAVTSGDCKVELKNVLHYFAFIAFIGQFLMLITF